MVNFKTSNILITSFKGYKNPKKIHADLCDYFSAPKGTDLIVRIDDCINDLEELLNENEESIRTEDGTVYSKETMTVVEKIINILKNSQNEVEYVWLDY